MIKLKRTLRRVNQNKHHQKRETAVKRVKMMLSRTQMTMRMRKKIRAQTMRNLNLQPPQNLLIRTRIPSHNPHNHQQVRMNLSVNQNNRLLSLSLFLLSSRLMPAERAVMMRRKTLPCLFHLQKAAAITRMKRCLIINRLLAMILRILKF